MWDVIIISLIDIQSENILSAKFKSDDDKLIVFNDLHRWNAQASIEITVDGMSIFSSFSHLEKAWFFISKFWREEII